MLPELTIEDIQRMIRDIEENMKILDKQYKRAKAHESPLLEPGCKLDVVFPNARSELYEAMRDELKYRKYDLQNMLEQMRKEEKDAYKKEPEIAH